MKIAICISGLVRTYRETYENYISSLINPNRHHDIDVYISAWNIEHSNTSTERLRRVMWFGEGHPQYPENLVDFYDLYEKYKPKSIAIDNSIDFIVPDWVGEYKFYNMKSLLSMWYKLYHADMLCQLREMAIGKYDVIIRTRFDIAVPAIDVDKLDLSKIYIPRMRDNDIDPRYSWCNDTFAVGTSDNIHTYCKIYHDLQKLLSKYPVQPEILLHAHLVENGITYVPLDFDPEFKRYL